MNIELIGEHKNIVKCLERPGCVPDPRGLGCLCFDNMTKYKNNIAQIDAETGKTLTHGEVLLGSIRVAQHLLERNISKNDIIVVCASNNMELVFSIFAGLFLEVRIAFMDTSLPKCDMNYLLKIINPRFIFCDESCADLLATSAKDISHKTEVIVFGKTEIYTPFSEFTTPTGTETNFQVKPVEDVHSTATIMFSSGTTGFPKGICCTHYSLQTNQEIVRLGINASIILTYSTFYWISATMAVILSILCGSARVIANKFNVDTAMHIIEKYKVTFTQLSLYQATQLIKIYNGLDYDTTKLNTCYIIGGKLSAEQWRKAKQLFPHSAVSNAYGITEQNGYIAVFDSKRDRHLINTKVSACGRILSGITYKIVDIKTGKVLGPNQTGELRTKSKIVMKGYLNNPEETKAAFDDDGFLKTGDLAYYDEDYCIYIVDRIKNILKYRGMVQSSQQLEDILVDHAEIKEAVIIGKPHSEDGDHATAFIILEDDSSLTKEQIMEYYNEIPQCYTQNDPMLCPPADNRVTPDPRGIGCVFFDKMTEFANDTAQIDAETGDSITHGEVLLRSIRCAQHLLEHGITRNDIVALCTYNHMDSCVPFLACQFLGVKVSSLDPTLSPGDSTYLLKLVSPRYVFCTPESEKMMENSIAEAELDTEIIVFGKTKKNIPFSTFAKKTGSEHKYKPRIVEDIFETAVIFFSSGTTGYPKGICTTHYGLLSQNHLLGLNQDPRVCLYYTTLYWISGVILLTMTILFGGARVFARKFDEFTCMKYVEKYKVTMTFLAPIYTYKITQNPETCNYDTRSLNCIIVGGGPTGAEQMKKFRKLLPHTVVCNMYGMTEVAGVATMFNIKTDLDLLESKLESAGKPVAGLSYKVVDPDSGKILGPNQRGELRMKGKCITTGYHNRPEESKKAFDSDGYLYTGDIAYYDEEYCFYIVDRIKDLLKYQSWHVAPAEIECVILTHPAVKSVVVVGIHDEVDGDLPMAVIILKPNASATEEEITEFVNARVSERKKIRAGVKFVESIPVTPSGKLRRRDVREWVVKGQI